MHTYLLYRNYEIALFIPFAYKHYTRGLGAGLIVYKFDKYFPNERLVPI
jgi:hypothetical protein